jgi:AraC-like DNA-binding protein
MRIAALLPDESYADLCARLSPATTVHRLPDGARALSSLSVIRPELFVFDPTLVRGDTFSQLTERVAESGAPAMVYARPTSLALRRILEFASRVSGETVLRDAHENLKQFESRLKHAHEPSAEACLVSRIAPRVMKMPPRIREPITLLLFDGMPLCTATQLASEWRIPRRSLDRWTHRVGIASIAVLVAAVRLTRAWSLMEGGRLSISRCSVEAGFPSPAEMAR